MAYQMLIFQAGKDQIGGAVVYSRYTCKRPAAARSSI